MENFTRYDIKPEGMVNYLRYNGPHFSKKLCDFAISKMLKKRNGKLTPIQPLPKQDLDSLLTSYDIKIENNQLYDYLYVANYCKHKLLGSSIVDDEHFLKYIKDVLEDEEDGLIFNRWYADMCYKGIAIDWEEVI